MSDLLPYDDDTFKLFYNIAVTLNRKINSLKISDFKTIDNLPKCQDDSWVNTEYRRAKGCLTIDAKCLVETPPKYFGKVNFVFVYSNCGDTVTAPCAFFDDPNSQLDDSKEKLSFNTYFYLTNCDGTFLFITENGDHPIATIVHELTHSYDCFIARKDGTDDSATHNKTEDAKNYIYHKYKISRTAPLSDSEVDELISNYLEALYFSMKTEKNAHIAQYKAVCELRAKGCVSNGCLTNLSSRIEQILERLEESEELIKTNLKSIKEHFDKMELGSIFSDSYTKATDEEIVNDITTILRKDLQEITSAFESIRIDYKIQGVPSQVANYLNM